MDVQVSTTPFADSDAELLVVAATTENDEAVVAGDTGDLGVDLSAALAAVGFTGGKDETARIPRPDGGSVLAVGCGEELTRSTVRSVGAMATRAGRSLDTVAVLLPPLAAGNGTTTQVLVEGLVLGAYKFQSHKSEPDESRLGTVTIHGGGDEAAAEVGRVLGEATTLTRDLVNTAPNHKRPDALAARAVELVEGTGIRTKVLDGDALREGGYGGLLAVGQGSSVDPQLVELTWDPSDADADHIALVGKGITFDTGGISLKPSGSMETMKMDMGGAATVLAVMQAIARLQLPVRVTGILCLAENMPSGTAQRVSDVYTALGGTTVEVMNTDAEGRLVMADGIVHAGEIGATTIVDVATLTGAAVVSLGRGFSLLMSDDDDLAEALRDAGERADERMWRMPLGTAEFRDKLDSTTADIKNVGGREAGSITAGLFLHHFVPEGVRWAHLDIAGTAWNESEGGIESKGASGVPARAMLTWLGAGSA